MTDFVRDSVDLEFIISCIIKSIDEASSFNSPFLHLTLNDFFPKEIFAAMLESMPVTSDYRPMSGRSRTHDLADGTHTRIKLDLFPELIRHLPEHKQKIWILVGQALRSAQVQDTFVRRLTPTLAKQHGQRYSVMDLYPVPSLTCDSTGYAIPIHTDTHWKGITVQLYLPPDDTLSHIGTVFHEKCKCGSFRIPVTHLPSVTTVGILQTRSGRRSRDGIRFCLPILLTMVCSGNSEIEASDLVILS
jgi:hypothetical protein